jgi:RND family efflux transporter MFP subunit
MKKMSIAILCVVALMLSACSQKKEQKEVIKTVRVDTVRVYDRELSATFPGKVKAASDVNLAFRVSGTIKKTYVDAGSRVKKDDILAELDPRDYQIQLSATEAEYHQIKKEAERVMDLYKKESVTANDYDKAVYGLQQITAKYNAHKNALEDTKLRAPFDGYVQKRFYSINETVSAGMPIVAMINTGNPVVEINIPASNFVKRDHFESFSCTVDSYPEQIFPLEVIGINQKANLNQLYTMRLRFKKNEKELLPSPGMTTMVTMRYDNEESGLVYIPLSALFEVAGMPHVWIYDQGVVTARKVKLYEIRMNGIVALSEGLRSGDVIISAGVHGLNEGEKVKLIPPITSTNIGGLL